MPCPICQREHGFTRQQALALLAKTPKQLEAFAGRVSPTRASSRPAPDKWSVKEIACHLTDCEWVFGVRYRKIAAEPGTALPAFDQDAWAGRLGYERMALKPVLSTFGALRGANIAILKSLPAEAWAQSGEHPSYGPLRLDDLILHITAHDVGHLRRVEELCPAPPPKTRKRTKPKARRKPGRK